jgi:alpha-galactosidase
LNIALAQKITNEAKAFSKYYYGDVYPLTPITTDEKDWLSYQCDRPDLGEGMVMAFRRKFAVADSLTVKLQGLKLAKTYEVENVDSGKKQLVTSKELAAGLHLSLPNPQSSTSLIYREAK